MCDVVGEREREEERDLTYGYAGISLDYPPHRLALVLHTPNTRPTKHSGYTTLLIVSTY